MSRKAKFLTAVISECLTATKKRPIKYPWKKSNIFKLKWDELKDEPYEGTGQFFIGFPSNKEIIKEANKLNIDYDVVFVKSPTTFYTHNVSGLYNECSGRVIGTGTINTQEDQVIDKKGNIIKKTKITKDGPIIYHTSAEDFLKNLRVKEKKTKMKKIKIVPKKEKVKWLKIKLTPKIDLGVLTKKPTKPKMRKIKILQKYKKDVLDNTTDKCISHIDDFLSILYNPRKRKQENFDKFKDLVDAVVSNDFYPTPPKYSSIIYDIVKDFYHGNNDIELYDVASGLGSLSLDFLKKPNMGDNTKIKNISMFEYNPVFADALSCFENHKGVDVKIVEGDFLKIDIPKHKKYDNAVYLCNPPFRGSYNGKSEKQLWVFFLVKILESFINYRQTLFAIVPPNAMLGEKLKDDILHHFEITNKTLLKKLGSMLGRDVSGGLNYPFEFVSLVSGFKGLTKSGKIRKVPDMVLIKFRWF